ncbi:hypothetical protein K456DRAFT_41809 [Colletotrichum gloeosporioides 23]|nr:hypothetical protein K456DRAFT_41809 [Colletotrichum gloeosporioides 23]
MKPNSPRGGSNKVDALQVRPAPEWLGCAGSMIGLTGTRMALVAWPCRIGMVGGMECASDNAHATDPSIWYQAREATRHKSSAANCFPFAAPCSIRCKGERGIDHGDGGEPQCRDQCGLFSVGDEPTLVSKAGENVHQDPDFLLSGNLSDRQTDRAPVFYPVSVLLVAATDRTPSVLMKGTTANGTNVIAKDTENFLGLALGTRAQPGEKVYAAPGTASSFGNSSPRLAVIRDPLPDPLDVMTSAHHRASISPRAAEVVRAGKRQGRIAGDGRRRREGALGQPWPTCASSWALVGSC